MSNLLKYYYVNYQEEETRIIDSNEQMAEKMEKLSILPEETSDIYMTEEEGFEAGLEASPIDLLVQDGGESPVIKGELKERQEEAQSILEEAKTEAEKILEEARTEAEALRHAAKEEGRNEGYQRGVQEGAFQLETQRKNMEEESRSRLNHLEEEYQQKKMSMEVELVDTIGGIFEHVFQVEFSDRKDIIFHLIQKTLHHVTVTKDFLIHVSKEDFGYVTMQKKDLLEGIPGSDTIEIIEDMTLSPNECMIETDGGIFDCSLGTQLQGLMKELKLLSYEKQ